MDPELPDSQAVRNILKEINMNEKELEEAVVHMQNWLKKQPHLPKSADDITLKGFIIGSKSIERAKDKFDAYYSARIRYYSPFFEDRDPTKIKWYKGQKILSLPGLTPDNCKVLLYTMPLKEGLSDFQSEEVFRTVLMYYELMIRKFYMSSGVYVLCDMANISLELTLKASLSLSSQFAKIYQDCYPIRLKGMIAFNAPTFAEPFFNTFMKPFFSQKLQARMSIHSGDNCLQNYIPIEMLPSDYGGKNESSDKLFELNKSWMESSKGWLLKQGSEKPMEDFRPKPSNDNMKGTFRKIEAE